MVNSPQSTGKTNHLNPLNDLIVRTPDLQILCQGVDPIALGIVPAHLANRLQLHDSSPRRVLVITDQILRLPNRARVWGYAWHAKNIAVVSTRGLNPGVNTRRLANVIAHEFGHLDGYAHCATDGCLMQPAASPEALEHRAFVRCGQCPHTVTRRDCAWALAGCVLCMALVHFILG